MWWRKKDKTEKLIAQLVFWKPEAARRDAIRALGTIDDARAVNPLIKALKSRNEDIRSEAIEALSKIGTSAVEPLVRTLQAPYASTFQHGTVEKILVRIGTSAVEPLIKVIEKSGGDVCRTAVESLGNIGDTRAVEPVIKILERWDVEIRKAAAEALGKIGDIHAVEPLIQTLEDKQPDVRGEAAKALGKIGDIHAVEPLIQTLEDKQPDVRGEAAKALGELSDVRAVKPLLRTLEMDENWYARGEAAEALRKIHDPLAIEAFRKALVKDEHWYVRAIAIQFLAGTVDNHEIELFIPALKDTDSNVREKATEILKKVCESIKTVFFGCYEFKELSPCTTLQNPDTTELTIPLSNLESIKIHAESYDFHLVERFITYAINYIGQKHLKEHVKVHIYGDPDKLHPNLRNSLENLCKRVEVHEGE